MEIQHQYRKGKPDVRGGGAGYVNNKGMFVF